MGYINISLPKEELKSSNGRRKKPVVENYA
jgi:hypothetical protein